MVEIGEYVKLENGTIFIVTPGLKTFINEHESRSEKDLVEFLGRIKHSKQLIDLIEVGDIVKDEYNKYEVAFVKNDKIYCNDYNLDDSLITLTEQDIKEILTKESYMANCYKVGGEDE